MQLDWLGNGPKNKNMCVGERIRATLFEGWFKVGLYSIVSREKVAHEMEIIIFFSFIQLDRKIDSQRTLLFTVSSADRSTKEKRKVMNFLDLSIV